MLLGLSLAIARTDFPGFLLVFWYLFLFLGCCAEASRALKRLGGSVQALSNFMKSR